MSDRQTVEKRRLQRDIQRKRERNRQLRRRRNRRIVIICSLFSIIIILTAIFIIVHSISDKSKLRDEGIKAFESGDYQTAIEKFNHSLNNEQWFSSKMDFDTGLYLSACYMRTGDYQKASANYKYMLDNYSSSSATVDEDKLTGFKLLADALEESGNGNISESTINQLKKELDDGNTSVSLYLGTCYQQMGEYEEMIKYYNMYIDEYGINTYIAYQLSAYYLDIDDTETASGIVNKGLNAGDDLYLDKVLFNDVIITEKSHDYAGALQKAESLVNKYPNEESYQKEYDFLYSRVNIDSNPVHTEGDAEVTD